MIIYNETIIVDETIYDEWMEWMRTTHIPAVMATGYFSSYQILNVIDSPNEGITTCFQYHTDSPDKFAEFYNLQLPALHAKHRLRYENRFVLYDTLMETIG